MEDIAVNIHQIRKNASLLDRRLYSITSGKPNALYKAASHMISNGGKRLRPYMTVKSCMMLGGKMSDAMPAALAIEMVHNFTLVHDDIMDNDEMRHGIPTVHKKYGLPVAILAGDVLFSKAFEIVTLPKIPHISFKLSERLAKACTNVCEGQMLDIDMAKTRKIPSRSQYIDMIRKKTSALFDAACAMGAISAKADQKDITKLGSFGNSLGIAFQITDDIIGAMGDSSVTKKPVGNDIREGKKSLPILIALEKSNSTERKTITKCFGNKHSTKSELTAAVLAMRKSNAEKESRSIAQKYARSATRSLSEYSGSSKKELASLLDFILKREQ
ncbi:MAG: Geranylgeranyl diphosphate synthase [Cenarchaeum symbiont of Oopsacas minuta]|nr:Geranylgeranyl diphosphate synthase [Cenarchaeum symbiont of Oopsacas minuta]